MRIRCIIFSIAQISISLSAIGQVHTNGLNIDVFDLDTRETIPNVKVSIDGKNGTHWEFYTDSLGFFECSDNPDCIPNNSNYSIKIEADGYLVAIDSVFSSTSDDTIFIREYYLKSNCNLGKHPTLNEYLIQCCLNYTFVLFEPNSLSFDPEFVLGFDLVRKLLLDNPDLIIKLSGYADDQEQFPTTSSTLAQMRAKEIKKKFIEEGINSNRIICTIGTKKDMYDEYSSEISVDTLSPDSWRKRVSIEVGYY